MATIQISSITGTSPYQLYVSDVYDNNITFLGSFSGSVPPTQYFYLPELFNTAPIVKIIRPKCNKFKMVDGCSSAQMKKVKKRAKTGGLQ